MYRSAIPVAVLVVLAGLVMLAFRPVPGSSGDVETSPGDATTDMPAVEPKSPFPLLALWSPWDSRDGTKLLQPVDPLTLDPLPGYEPIEIGNVEAGGFVEFAASPDGGTVALAVHRPSAFLPNAGSELHLVDLATWQDRLVVEWPYFVQSFSAAQPQYAPTGDRLYWLMLDEDSGDRMLVSYELTTGNQQQVTTFPTDFAIHEYLVSEAQGRLYVFGNPTQQGLDIDGGSVSGNFASSDAQVLVFDLNAGSMTDTIDIGGVVAGGLPIEGLDGDGYPIQNTSPGLEWDLDAKRLYVGHAGPAGQATIVDLENGDIQDQFSLDEGSSWLERLANWLAPTAQAVVRALSYGYATLPGDDGVLAVSAATEQLTQDRQELESGTHLPVWAIDTESGDQLWQAHVGGVLGLAEAPDSEHLLVHSASRIFRLDAVSDDEGQALYLLDSSSGDIVAQVDIPGRPSAGKSSMILSNDLVYVRTRTEAGPAVIVVDSSGLSIVGGWQREEGQPSIYKLLPLP